MLIFILRKFTINVSSKFQKTMNENFRTLILFEYFEELYDLFFLLSKKYSPPPIKKLTTP
jgi:hypothetical protein